MQTEQSQTQIKQLFQRNYMEKFGIAVPIRKDEFAQTAQCSPIVRSGAELERHFPE